MPSTEPILVPSSDSEAIDNLDFSEVQPAVKDIVEHSFNQGVVWVPTWARRKKSWPFKVESSTPNLVLAIQS